MRFTIENIAERLNARSEGHRVGELQALRQRLKHLRRERRPIFARGSIFPQYAYHWGGRTELQFNIGEEVVGGRAVLRYGVAFSFELSQGLPRLDPLVPKVERFNAFLRLHPDLYADLRMWHFRSGARSQDQWPAPIREDLVQEGNFVFLGRYQPRDAFDVERILSDFDQLLPLYEFVEGETLSPTPVVAPGSFVFRSGHAPRPPGTTADALEARLNVSLRHNVLQSALFERLAAQHGRENVGTENPSGIGTWIDAVVRTSQGYWFYEIKTALSARACLREAIGQLLEYTYWPGAQEAQRLVVVGEPPLDEEARAYLAELTIRFGLPVSYEQLVVP